MRALLFGLLLIPTLTHAQVSEIIPAITKGDSYQAERFAKAESEPEVLDSWTQQYLYPICGYDKCDADQKNRLQKKILGIIKRSWEYGIQKEAIKLNAIHELIASCSPEAKKVFAGEGSASCAQLVTCEGEQAAKLYQLVKIIDETAFKRTLEKEELEFEGLDLSSLLSDRYPVNGGNRSTLINGLGSYRNKKGGREQDGVSTSITKLPGIVTIRSISCDRDRKVKSDGSVKSEKNNCVSVISRNTNPEVIYGKATSFFTNSIESVKDTCFQVKKKKK